MLKLLYIFAGISGFLSVALGAFGAHALRGNLSDRLMHAFETGVAYQLNHTIVLLISCLLIEHWGKHWSLEFAAYGFAVGIVLFSGSLYLLAVTGAKWLGPVTPLGGLFLLAGWCFLTIGIWQHSYSAN